MTLPRALSPLRHAAYRLLVATMALSLLTQGLWVVALVWQVVALDGGPAALSLVAGLSAGGMLASTLIGGALADRVPQRRILLAGLVPPVLAVVAVVAVVAARLPADEIAHPLDVRAPAVPGGELIDR